MHRSVTALFQIAKAQAFATGAHGATDQRRKYTNDPYIVHPEAVAELVAHQSVGASWETICAAWLHDVLEDTHVTLATLYDVFGNKVALMVQSLTNVPLSAGNRATRFRLNLDRLTSAMPEAKTVKLADLIDNTRTIVTHDPNFAKVYLREKMETLEVLKEGNSKLWAVAEQICREGIEALEGRRVS